MMGYVWGVLAAAAALGSIVLVVYGAAMHHATMKREEQAHAERMETIRARPCSVEVVK